VTKPGLQRKIAMRFEGFCCYNSYLYRQQDGVTPRAFGDAKPIIQWVVEGFGKDGVS
jgi:hypothetical protein